MEGILPEIRRAILADLAAAIIDGVPAGPEETLEATSPGRRSNCSMSNGRWSLRPERAGPGFDRASVVLVRRPVLYVPLVVGLAVLQFALPYRVWLLLRPLVGYRREENEREEHDQQRQEEGARRQDAVPDRSADAEQPPRGDEAAHEGDRDSPPTQSTRDRVKRTHDRRYGPDR
jgi:hypothetical protein